MNRMAPAWRVAEPPGYLALVVHGDPADPRTDDIGGDLTPDWGKHLIDANVAMGTSRTWSPPRQRPTQAAADSSRGRPRLVAGPGPARNSGGDHAFAGRNPPADVPGTDQAGPHDDAGQQE
jgi:hypothetical protein